jgi:type III pantothenate kinase
MNILVDIGNSRLKWAIQQAAHILPQRPIDHHSQADYLQLLTQSWQQLAAPQKLAISAVADPAIKQQIIALVSDLWPEAEIVLPTAIASAFGVRNAYQQPEKLGLDRWLALLAAHRYYPGPCCIVDAGTAITLDVLNADGQHLGGLICPGLRLMKKSLSTNTVALAFNEQMLALGLADNTAAAIDSGSRFAALGMIETVLGRLDTAYQLILTGGDALSLSQHLPQAHIVDVDLVFKGLNIILDQASNDYQ